MAIDWNASQHRSVDPFSPVNSDNVSAISAAFTELGKGRGISNGLTLDQLSSINIRINSGTAVKDYIVIHFTTDIIVNILDTNAVPGFNYIVLNYRYEKIEPPNYATIDIIPVASFDQHQHLILGTVELNLAGTEIVTDGITDDGREDNLSLIPISEASILELCDTPDYNNGAGLSGQAGGLLIVDNTEDAFVFNKLGDNFCVNNDTISVCKVGNTDVNSLLHRDGTNSPSATMDWDGNRLYNLGDPTDDTDAVSLGCLKSCITEEKTARETCDSNLRDDITNLQTDITNIQNNGSSHANDSDCLGGQPANCYALKNHTHEFKNLTCVPGSYGTSGQVLGTDGTKLVWTAASSGGSDNFKALTDTPNTLTADCMLGTDGTNVVLRSPADVGGTINLKDLKDVDPALAPADTQVLAYDGTNSKWVACDPATGSGGVSTFISLSDTPAAYNISQNDMFLKVCVDGSGSCIDFVDLATSVNDSIALGDLCDVNVAGGTTGQVLTIVDDGSGGSCWAPQAVSGGTGTSYEYFHLLLDTPSAYTAADDGKVVVVCYDSGGTNTGLKFKELSSIVSDQLDLGDLKDVDTSGAVVDQVLTAYEDTPGVITWKPKVASGSSSGSSCLCCLLDVDSDIYTNHSPESNPNISTGIPYVVAVNSASNGVAACSLNTLFTSMVEDSYLYQLKDVNSAVQTPVDNSVLIYDTNNWCSKQLCSADLYDIDFVSPSAGDVLCWNAVANKWCVSPISSDGFRNSLELKDLCDVTDTLAPQSDYVLTYETANNCNKWIAKPAASGGSLSFNITCGTDIPPTSGNPGDLYIQYVL